MAGDYPSFRATYAYEELVEHFLLSPAERALVDTCCGDVNRQGMAVLLLQQVPGAVCTFIAHQLQLRWDLTEHYPWRSGTHDAHLTLIRQYTGFRYPTGQDKRELEAWLRTLKAQESPTPSPMPLTIKALGLMQDGVPPRVWGRDVRNIADREIVDGPRTHDPIRGPW